jgi:hypothetical protein
MKFAPFSKMLKCDLDLQGPGPYLQKPNQVSELDKTNTTPRDVGRRADRKHSDSFVNTSQNATSVAYLNLLVAKKSII